MNISELLYRKIRKYKNNVFCEDGERRISYLDYLSMVTTVCRFLKQKCQRKVLIHCQQGLNMSIGILAGLFAGKVNIPINRNLNDVLLSNIYEQINDYYELTDRDVIECIYNSSIKSDESVNYERYPFIVFTSGTSGRFKGAELSGEGLIFNIKSIIRTVRYQAADRILISRSLAHIAALVGDFLAGLYKGAQFVFYDGEFIPKKISNIIQSNKVTVWNTTPTCICAFLTGHTNISLQKCVITGEVLTESVYKKIKTGLPQTIFYCGYGMTEASSRVSMAKLPSTIQTGYAGKILRGIKVKVVNDEIIIKSPGIMRGYIGGKRIESGWFYTNDRGKKHGRKLWVWGRKDRLIKRAGVSIDPVMIENIIQSDKYVADCKVFGKKDDFLGEKICMQVKPIDSAIVTKEYIERLCKKSLPSYMRFNEIEICDDIKLGATGKK